MMGLKQANNELIHYLYQVTYKLPASTMMGLKQANNELIHYL